MTQTDDRLVEAMKKAEESSKVISDPELRKIAFERVLAHLLEISASTVSSKQPPTFVSGEGPSQTNRSIESHGIKSWITELVDEHYFDEQRTSKAILSRLQEDGHHLKLPDITRQLIDLVQEKILRRNKISDPDTKRKVWAYSKW